MRGWIICGLIREVVLLTGIPVTLPCWMKLQIRDEGEITLNSFRLIVRGIQASYNHRHRECPQNKN